jgi:hypothetical protein
VHPDGREEPGGVRRYHPDAPGLGHAFTTVEDGQPASWEVVDRELAFDEEGEPFLDLVARRDFVEPDELPDHELEHALADDGGADRTFARLDGTDLSLELVALEPGQAPDWVDAQSYLDALTFDEIEDDLFEQCGVDTRQDPRETWLETVKERLRGDLASFRADVEGGHDQVEEWDYLDGRVFAGVGSYEEEADPDSGYGWLCRLLDAGVLAAAGFRRVRKSELQVAD